MTEYHVNAAEVAEAAGRARATGEAIRGEVATMLAQLTALEGTWRGTAAHAFAALLDQWRAAQAQVDVALDALSGGLAAAASEYANAESSAARLFAR